MDKEGFKEKLNFGVDKVVSSAKKAIGKAGVAMQDFSDKSVIRIEKRQFESKRETAYIKLGSFVAERFSADENAAVSASEEAVAAIMVEIQHCTEEIKKRDDALAEKAGKSEDSEKTDSQE